MTSKTKQELTDREDVHNEDIPDIIERASLLQADAQKTDDRVSIEDLKEVSRELEIDDVFIDQALVAIEAERATKADSGTLTSRRRFGIVGGVILWGLASLAVFWLFSSSLFPSPFEPTPQTTQRQVKESPPTPGKTVKTVKTIRFGEDGHAKKLEDLFEGDLLATASGLRFSGLTVPIDREWTYTAAHIQIDNSSPTARIPHDMHAVIKLLCIDGDGKPHVIKYTTAVKIPVKGEQVLKFSGPYNKDVRYYNADSFIPKDAEIMVYLDNTPIYHGFWRQTPTAVQTDSDKRWWHDDSLLVKHLR